MTFNGTSGNTTVSLSGALTPGSLTVTGTNNYLFNGSGSISGVTALNVAGPGALTLATTGNSYSQGTNVTGGTLALGVSNALPTAGMLTLGTTGSAGTFDLAGFNQQVGSLAVGAGATAANQTIGNSNSASVSTLTFSNSTPSNFAGTIQDGLVAQWGTGRPERCFRAAHAQRQQHVFGHHDRQRRHLATRQRGGALCGRDGGQCERHERRPRPGRLQCRAGRP